MERHTCETPLNFQIVGQLDPSQPNHRRWGRASSLPSVETCENSCRRLAFRREFSNLFPSCPINGKPRANHTGTRDLESLWFWHKRLDEVEVYWVAASWSRHDWYQGDIYIPTITGAQLSDLIQGRHIRPPPLRQMNGNAGISAEMRHVIYGSERIEFLRLDRRDDFDPQVRMHGDRQSFPFTPGKQHPNHSAAFFRMLDAVLPDWRERKQRLEQAEI